MLFPKSVRLQLQPTSFHDDDLDILGEENRHHGVYHDANHDAAYNQDGGTRKAGGMFARWKGKNTTTEGKAMADRKQQFSNWKGKMRDKEQRNEWLKEKKRTAAAGAAGAGVVQGKKQVSESMGDTLEQNLEGIPTAVGNIFGG